MGFLTKKKNYAADLRYLSGRDGVEHLVAVIDRVGKKRRVVYAALTSVAPPHVIRSLLGIGREEYEKLKDEAKRVEKEGSIPGFERVGVFMGTKGDIRQCKANFLAICGVVPVQDVVKYRAIEEVEYQRLEAHARDVEASEARGDIKTAQQTWDIKADAAAREARGAVQLGALETALKGARSEFRQSKAEVAESNAWARQNNALIQESAQKLAQAVAQKEEDLEEVKEQLSSLLKEVEEVKEVKSSLKEMVALLREKNPARITRGDSYAPDSPAFTTPPRPRSDELPPDFDRDFNKCNIGGWDAVPTPSPTTAKKALLSERGAFLPRGDANVAVDSPADGTAAIDAFDAPSPKALPPPPEEMKSPEEDVPPRVRGPGLSGHLAARFSDPRLSYAEKCGHLAAKRATRTDENGEFLPWPQPAPKSSADPVVLRVGSLPKPTEAQLAAGEAQANAK